MVSLRSEDEERSQGPRKRRIWEKRAGGVVEVGLEKRVAGRTVGGRRGALFVSYLCLQGIKSHKLQRAAWERAEKR